MELTKSLALLTVLAICSTSADAQLWSGLSGLTNFLTSIVSNIGGASKSIVNFTPLPQNLKEIANQITNCLLVSKWEDKYLGRVDIDVFGYCKAACSRFIPGLLCCNPAPPSDIKVLFKLYERSGFQRNLTWDDVNSQAMIERGSRYRNLIITAHGYLEEDTTTSWMFKVKDGYLKRGADAVIVTDWDHGNAADYFQAAANVRSVGMMIGKILTSWNMHKKALVVGFSLGAQIAGEAAKYVQEMTGGQKIAECHGLDPAGPFFDGCPDDMVLDRSDCDLVQSLHTSAEFVRTAGPLNRQFGTYKKTGHCDYWINCGYSQYPCSGSTFGELFQMVSKLQLLNTGKALANMTKEFSCSHTRAPDVYVSQLTHDCQFPAQSCINAQGQDACAASNDCLTTGPDVGFHLMPDAHCDASMNLNFYVQTKAVGKGARLC